MTQIPENECSIETLYQWYEMHDQLTKLKAQESLLRKKIFNHFFKEPKEGTNSVPLPDDFVLKGVMKMNRDVSEAVLLAKDAEFRAAGINVDNVIKKTPELKKSAYNELTNEQQKLFDQALIIKPGSVELTVEPNAARKKRMKAEEKAEGGAE